MTNLPPTPRKLLVHDYLLHAIREAALTRKTVKTETIVTWATHYGRSLKVTRAEVEEALQTTPLALLQELFNDHLDNR